MAVSIIFSGAPEENPEDFMRAFLRDMGTADLAQKLDFFENYLKSGSDADNWFTKLDDITKNTWPAVRAAFKARFPAIPTVQKSFAEYEAELSDISLKEEDLGRKVVVGGNEVWSHQAHRGRGPSHRNCDEYPVHFSVCCNCSASPSPAH